MAAYSHLQRAEIRGLLLELAASVREFDRIYLDGRAERTERETAKYSEDDCKARARAHLMSPGVELRIPEIIRWHLLTVLGVQPRNE